MTSGLVLSPFDPAALKEMANEAVEMQIRPYLADFELEVLAMKGPAWMGHWNGRVIGCAGLAEIYGDGSTRAAAWMVLKPMPVAAVVALAREIRRRLASLPYRRIEADIEAGNDKARRWAELLGFRIETKQKLGFFPNGGPAAEYVVLK